MKEATGELNMTVVTLVAIGAIAALFYFVIWPMIQRQLVQNTCNTYGSGYTAQKVDDSVVEGNEKVSDWQCCPEGQTAGGEGCIAAD